MTNSFKNRVTEDLQIAKTEGKFRAEKIKEIVKVAVSEAMTELKAGSSEIRFVVKDAIAAVIETVKETGGEVKEEVTASVEGVIEGVSLSKREKLDKTQASLQQLQAQIDAEEQDLQNQIDEVIINIEDTGKDSDPEIRSAISSAVEAIKDSEEADLMRKRYAQLQAQLAIVQANLSARYGERYDDVKKYLDDAKSWYDKTAPKAETVAETTKQKHQDFEQKLSAAGTAVARKEKQVKQVLKELWKAATETFRDEK